MWLTCWQGSSLPRFGSFMRLLIAISAFLTGVRLSILVFHRPLHQHVSLRPARIHRVAVWDSTEYAHDGKSS